MSNIAVIGSCFGDEGKGLMTDYFSSSNCFIVRYNGGPNAGHTVCDQSGKRHVFSHFGSGSFTGASTYLSSYFIFNPYLWNKELLILKTIGIHPKVFYNPSGMMTLPYDVLINQEIERQRGISRHGSCGCGINETVTRHEKSFITEIGDCSSNTNKIKSYYKHLRDSYFLQRIEDLKISPSKIFWDIWNSDVLLDNFIFLKESFSKENTPILDNEFANIIKEKQVIFEGAQGLLLDEDHKFFPHVTRSKTGLKNIVSLSKSFGIDNIDVVYTARTYMTRHGAGSFPSENNSLKYYDNTNNTNEFQGSLRFGDFDVDLFTEAVKKDMFLYGQQIKTNASIAITHVDQTNNKINIIVDNRKKEADNTEFIKILEEESCLKVKYLSYGPTRNDVKNLK